VAGASELRRLAALELCNSMCLEVLGKLSGGGWGRGLVVVVVVVVVVVGGGLACGVERREEAFTKGVIRPLCRVPPC